MTGSQCDTNSPEIWGNLLPLKSGAQHKCDYGHVHIFSAPSLTGATALAASASARVGAGLVTVIAPVPLFVELRCMLPNHVLLRAERPQSNRSEVCLFGSGGVSENTKPDFSDFTVLDAEAISFLPACANGNVIITPHQGEFARFFRDLKGSRQAQAKRVAAERGCIVVLKGEETLIASPTGRVVKNTNATPWLATAGTGDVLAGLIAGLVAQGMDPFDAAAAAVWIHGEAGKQCGAYLVASDLLDQLQSVLQSVTGRNTSVGKAISAQTGR
ncbi:MAG: NAD(P)H-hydrate dehydratase [Litorimonas sp.]